VAAVAVARKLSVLCWCLLGRGEDYAFARPSMVRRKLRRLELAAGAPHRKSGLQPDPVWNRDNDAAERRLAEHKPNEPTSGSSPIGRRAERRWARVQHRGAHLEKPSKGKAARQAACPSRPALRLPSPSPVTRARGEDATEG
jgi:hypothetical protein